MYLNALSAQLNGPRLGTQWAVVLLAVTTLAYAIRTLRRLFAPGLRRVPGPLLAKVTNLWIMKHVAQQDLHYLFNNLHQQYGPIVRYAPNKVSVADPSVIARFYGVNSAYLKSTFYNAFTSVYQGEREDNIFTTVDSAWHKHLKSAVAPAYSLSNLRQLEGLVDECSLEFLKAMRERAGSVVDIGTWVQWYAFDVISNLTFGQTFGFLSDQADRSGVLPALEAANVYNTLIGQKPKLHPWLLANERLMGLLNRLPSLAESNPVTMINKMIESAQAALDSPDRKEEKGTLIEHLNKVRRERLDRLSEMEAHAMLTSNLFAGSDTTAMAFRAIFYYLVKNPDIYDKLMDELDAAFKARKLSSIVKYTETAELPYLQATIKESLRLHPGVSYPLERVVPKGGAEIAGHFLPQDTVVGVHAWVIHRDRQIFGEDAEVFRPERWMTLDHERLRRMDRHFIPFGGGSRICLGRHISMLEMSKFVPTLLLRYKLEWASQNPDWTIKGYWVAKQGDVLMRLIPRTELEIQ